MNPFKARLFKPFYDNKVKKFKKLTNDDLRNACPHKAVFEAEYSLEKTAVQYHDQIKHLAPDAVYSSRVRVVKGYCPVCKKVHRVERISIMVSMPDAVGEWWSESFTL